jgi:hypothetical protein
MSLLLTQSDSLRRYGNPGKMAFSFIAIYEHPIVG